LLQDWHVTFGHIPVLFVLILLILFVLLCLILICLVVAPDRSGRKSSPTKTGNPINHKNLESN
jgi:hypothetical protein